MREEQNIINIGGVNIINKGIVGIGDETRLCFFDSRYKNKIKIKSYGKLMKNEVNSLFGINGKGSKSNILRKFLGVVSEK